MLLTLCNSAEYGARQNKINLIIKEMIEVIKWSACTSCRQAHYGL